MRALSYICMVIVCSLAPGMVHAQTQDHVPVGATSATDQDVKIHHSKKIFKFHKKFKAEARATEGKVQSSPNKKFMGQTRETERQGKSLHKRSRHRGGNSKQARVFNKHSNPAARNAERSRRSSRRFLLTK